MMPRAVDIFETALPPCINRGKSGNGAEGKLKICPGQPEVDGRNSERTVLAEICNSFVGAEAKLAKRIIRQAPLRLGDQS